MKLVDRLRQSFNATSTATVTLGTAVTGFRTVAQAIADGDLVAGDEIPMCVESGASWELSKYRVDSATQLTRLEVLASWTGGTAVTFPSGTKQIFCTPPAEYLNGIQAAALPVLTSVADATRLLALNPSNEAFLVTAAVLKAYIGGTAPPADSTAPGAPTNLASTNVGQTGYTITFTPGTDNVAVQRSEWSLDGSTWTPVSGGAAGNTFGVTGRTAGSTDTVRLRTVDTSGNVSTTATLSVTLQSAGGNAAPVMSGSIAKSSITSSGYTFAWDAPTDANGNGSKVQTSIDGGSTWTDHSFAAGSRTATGRTAGSTDQLRVRAVDAAGAVSNVLSDSVTMLSGTSYTLSRSGGDKSISSLAGQAITRGSPNAGTYDGYIAFNSQSCLNDEYIGVSPAPSETVLLGWGPSSTVPPSFTGGATDAGQKNPNGGFANANAANDFSGGRYYAFANYNWVNSAAGTYSRYAWIKVGSNAPVCLNPTSPSVATLA